MSFTKPTPLEILDRLTILARKIVETEVVGGGVEELRGEYEELLSHFPSAELSTIDMAARLGAINGAIWDAIARGSLGRAQELNKERAKLVGTVKL